MMLDPCLGQTPPLLLLLLLHLTTTLDRGATGLEGRRGAYRADPQDDFAAAAQEAQEISDLSDRIHAAEAEQQLLKRQYDEAEVHYKLRKESLERQITARNRQLEAHPMNGGAAHLKEKEKQYRLLLCSKFLDAFVLDGGKQARVHVQEICL